MRALPLLLAAAAVLAACAAPEEPSAPPEAVGERDDPDGTDRERTIDTDGRSPAQVDRSQHSVPLEDIHFNTFDGGSLALADASDEDVDGLADLIPPLTEPRYDPAEGGDWLDADDLVIGYVTEAGQAYAYPHKILNFHEIVNERLDGEAVLVSYCPLCRSGVVYDRELGGRELVFGNTSALFDNDLVMYDRQTASFWWQVAGEAIVGELTGDRLEPLPSSTMRWSDWRELHPDTLVLSRDTGHARPYEQDPFAGYAGQVDQGALPFPSVQDPTADDRLSPGTEVLGVDIGDDAVAYPLEQLGTAALHDRIGGTDVVVLSRDGRGAAFRPEAGGEALTFTVDGGDFVDEETGSRWDLAGRAVDGPLAGEALEGVATRVTFWFAYVAAFPEAEVRAG